MVIIKRVDCILILNGSSSWSLLIFMYFSCQGGECTYFTIAEPLAVPANFW